jgi:glycine cleavage system H protein
MTYGLQPYNPDSGPPGPTTLGFTAGIPNAYVAAQAIPAWQNRTEAALAARRARMAGRWFTPEHLWVAVDGEIATVGLTDYAASKFRAIVYVSLPANGASVTPEEPCVQVESMKAIFDLCAPLNGTVTEVNHELELDPGLINERPWDVGWMYRVRGAVGADGEVALPPELLSPAEYEELSPMSDG